MSAGCRNNLIQGLTFGKMKTEKIYFEAGLDIDHQYNMIVSNQNQSPNVRYNEVRYNKAGSRLEIIDYISAKNITVLITSQLATGEIKQYIRVKCDYTNFNKGEIASPYDVNFYGYGYTGEGPYNKTTHKKTYMHYSNMMLRSYDPGYKERNPTYIGVTVDPYFHCFQNFAYWSDLNYYEINGERMNLDKDILFKGNKLYHPLSCMYVPESINKLFLKNEGYKKSDLPLGCVYSKSGDNYQSTVYTSNGNKYLGKFRHPIDAGLAYKAEKEKIIKEVANDYYYNKGGQFIPQFQLVYEAMMNYEVDV